MGGSSPLCFLGVRLSHFCSGLKRAGKASPGQLLLPERRLRVGPGTKSCCLELQPHFCYPQPGVARPLHGVLEVPVGQGREGWSRARSRSPGGAIQKSECAPGLDRQGCRRCASSCVCACVWKGHTGVCTGMCERVGELGLCIWDTHSGLGVAMLG